MILRQVHMIDRDMPQDIHINDGIITLIHSAEAQVNTGTITFENAIAFPGLVNSHDHLDFNLFPQLGNRIYNNYAEWADDIHLNNKEKMNAVLKIPAALRIQWGIYKNLLNGVTTVVNHGPKLKVPGELITVFRQATSLHSLKFEKRWKLKLNRPLSPVPAIHIGEGTDEASSKEIDRLTRWNIFRKKIVGIHGVAMSKEQAKYFAALVWCPAANYFLLGKTAAINELRKSTTILFGTDSTLTAGWNIWKQLRLARETHLLTDRELYNAVTSNAATFWQLNSGSIGDNKSADIVIAKRKADAPFFDTFYALNPEDILLVLHEGNVRLYDESIKEQVSQHAAGEKFSRVLLNGSVKYVSGDVEGLINKIRHYDKAIQLPISI